MWFDTVGLLSLGIFKRKVYVNKPRTIQELNDEIIRHINDIEPQLCLRVIENTDHRIGGMPTKSWRAFGRYYVSHVIVIDPSIVIKNIKIIPLNFLFYLQLTSCVLVRPPFILWWYRHRECIIGNCWTTCIDLNVYRFHIAIVRMFPDMCESVHRKSRTNNVPFHRESRGPSVLSPAGDCVGRLSGRRKS